MSALIIIRTEVYNSKMMEFVDELSNWNHHIAKLYYYDDVTEIFFGLDLMGYAEPLEFYDAIKRYVKDVWYSCVGNSDVNVGKITPNYEWQSCKLETNAQKSTTPKKAGHN